MDAAAASFEIQCVPLRPLSVRLMSMPLVNPMLRNRKNCQCTVSLSISLPPSLPLARCGALSPHPTTHAHPAEFQNSSAVSFVSVMTFTLANILLTSLNLANIGSSFLTTC